MRSLEYWNFEEDCVTLLNNNYNFNWSLPDSDHEQDALQGKKVDINSQSHADTLNTTDCNCEERRRSNIGNSRTFECYVTTLIFVHQPKVHNIDKIRIEWRKAYLTPIPSFHLNLDKPLHKTWLFCTNK